MSKKAWIVGGASYVALGRLHDAIEVVANKLEAQHREEPNAPEPTARELADLRERWLEHSALQERSQSLWKIVNKPWPLEIFVVPVLVYRLVVLAAAIAILVRLLPGWVAH